MGRVHLFELNDQRWLPNALRVLVTDWLQTAITRLGFYKPALPLLRRSLEANKEDELVDLCSGGGGPLASILAPLLHERPNLRVVLTDLFPNYAAFERAARLFPGKVRFEDQPVDATKVPRRLAGFRTLFTAFHHFRPETAREILRDAASSRRPIAIFEFTGRDWLLPMRMLFTPLLVLLLTPWVRPFRWSRLLFTYVLPVAPLLLLWDGLVSDLRTYSPRELRSLVEQLEMDDYSWEIGRTRGPPSKVTYLLGTPAEPQRQIDAP